jgi:hypothetical protein
MLSKLERFAQMERGEDLFSYRTDGWSTWRVMRNSMHRSTVGLAFAELGRGTAARSFEALLATPKLLWLLIFGAKRDLVVKTCRSALRMRRGDKFRDVYFDGLLEREHSSFKFEEIDSPDFDTQSAQACHPADLDPVVFTFWGRVLGTFFPTKAAAPFSHKVANLMKEEIGVQVDPSWLLMRVSTVWWQARLYSALLSRLRPKTVLVSNTGEYGLRVACSRRRVRFVEMQHGIFDADHPDAVPVYAQGSAAELLLPDALACRGAFWIERLASTRQAAGEIVPVGNELIDLAREQRGHRPRTASKHLVLTSQGCDLKNLARWVADALVSAPPEIDWRFSIKLHPAYDVETRDFDFLARNSRVQIVRGADSPNVFELLADADLHLSISSACHFDAAAIGVRSVVIPLASHEIVLDIIDGQQICLARTPSDVWSFLALPPVDGRNAARFSAPGFVDNLQDLINDPGRRAPNSR